MVQLVSKQTESIQEQQCSPAHLDERHTIKQYKDEGRVISSSPDTPSMITCTVHREPSIKLVLCHCRAGATYHWRNAQPEGSICKVSSSVGLARDSILEQEKGRR